MDRQAVYEKVRAHLLKQGSKCVDKVGNCLYRGSNGTMCAIGCLIADEHFNARFNVGWAVMDDTVLDMLKKSGVDPHDRQDVQVLRELQDIHDNRDPFAWEVLLDAFAARWNLNVPVQAA